MNFIAEHGSSMEIIDLEAYLIYYYNNFIATHANKNILYGKDAVTNKTILLFNSLTDKSRDSSRFLTIPEHRSQYNGGGDLNIEYLVRKIDITESINF